MARKRPLALDKVAKNIRTLAATRAPYDTGNLSRKIKSYNTLNRMVKWNSKTMDASISLSVGPPGASYGIWFNDPPNVVSKRRKSLRATAKRRGNWDFGKKAFEDKSTKSLYKALAKELGVIVLEDIRKSVRAAIK